MKKENNGLQKFTNFDNLKTVENFKEFKETYPYKFDNLIEWLSDKLNNAIKENKDIDFYFNRIENAFSLLDNESITKVKRERWRLNEAKIKNCIHNELINKGQIPSVGEISDQTGLSRVTVSKHLTETQLSEFKNEQRETFKILSTNVLQRIYKIGMETNDIKALKLFFQLTGGNIQLETVVNNNYILINNTKIDNTIINQLPIESRETIEQIIIANKNAVR